MEKREIAVGPAKRVWSCSLPVGEEAVVELLVRQNGVRELLSDKCQTRQWVSNFVQKTSPIR
jgi:hypothetical protein